jgi:signal transduction histidine kinase
MQSNLAKGSIDLKLESSRDTDIRVDPDQLKQVLINLVRNAGESIASAGTVTLRVREEIAVIHSKRQPCVSIEVEDTGTGIPPELQQRVFDPFFTTKETGTGLGLSIAARTVERHGLAACDQKISDVKRDSAALQSATVAPDNTQIRSVNDPRWTVIHRISAA